MQLAQSKIKVAIFGGSGYGGSELLRILLFHPNVEIAFVTACLAQEVFKPVDQVAQLSLRGDQVGEALDQRLRAPAAGAAEHDEGPAVVLDDARAALFGRERLGRLVKEGQTNGDSNLLAAVLVENQNGQKG